MGRREELLKIVTKNGTDEEVKATQLVDELVFVEEQLKELKKLPFIKVNPKDPSQQKTTPAAKQYKELLQQYNNSLKLLLKMGGDFGEVEEESPLRQWLNSRKEREEDVDVES